MLVCGCSSRVPSILTIICGIGEEIIIFGSAYNTALSSAGCYSGIKVTGKSTKYLPDGASISAPASFAMLGSEKRTVSGVEQAQLILGTQVMLSATCL